MTFADAVKTVLSKYATFTGRAARPEYWWWTLFVFVTSLVLAVIDQSFIAPSLGYPSYGEESPGFLSLIFSLGVFVPGLAVTVRRLHDIDRSGWWILIAFIPLVGILVLIYWLVQPGTEGANQFGGPGGSGQPDATF